MIEKDFLFSKIYSAQALMLLYSEFDHICCLSISVYGKLGSPIWTTVHSSAGEKQTGLGLLIQLTYDQMPG